MILGHTAMSLLNCNDGETDAGPVVDCSLPVSDELIGLLDVGPLQPYHDWLFHADILGRADDTPRDDVTPHDAAEDVHEHRLHLSVDVRNTIVQVTQSLTLQSA